MSQLHGIHMGRFRPVITINEPRCHLSYNVELLSPVLERDKSLADAGIYTTAQLQDLCCFNR